MKGFTLIETLVAVAIMMLAVTGPLTIAHRGVQSALYAKDQVTAYYLAQDAVEYIRSVRDGNFLASKSWLEELDLCLNTDCMIDTIAGTKSNSGELLYNSSNGQYGYGNGGIKSGFTRTINIDDTVENNAMIEVKISWNTSLFTQTFTIQENMMDIFAPTP
ncbi:MAG: prepilin-type N-terminal cleavage/methylation domain-containing protein [Patescibacteria group bacterium]|nr:prepilin-type N-terminal cleavage/methylation domain-containing protein [Patescibacteria group bacterium]